MDDPRIIYLEKRKALVKAQDELESLAWDLDMVANAIKSFDLVLLPEEVTETAAPPQSYRSQNPHHIKPEDWPTFEDFVSALAEWRQARDAAEEAYQKVSDYDGIEELPQKPSERRRDDYRARPRQYSWKARKRR